MEDKKTDPLHCSFCGKSRDEVKKIIAGPDVYICEECVFISVDIIKQEAGITRVSMKHLNEWKKGMEDWVRKIQDKQTDDYKIIREHNTKIFDFQTEHSKQLNGYLEGFNKLLEKNLSCKCHKVTS